MKQVPLSTCERTSVTSCIQTGLRLDGRDFLQVREMAIDFGKDYGSCSVVLGHTRVLAQVTCDVVEPRPSRPNEGKVSISVHLSPMAAPHIEPNRSFEIVDELQQLLERNIKESRCLDLESLCILADESVWQLKVDVTVLNHAGNLWDACNLAAVSALKHFHRPDVTVEDDGRVTIHTLEEREAIPTFMKKIPVCLTYGFFMIEDQCYTIMDPTELEERVMSGKLVVGLNPHGEITSLVFPGRVSLRNEHIVFCVDNAFSKAKASAEMVQEVVERDLDKRKSVIKPDGFTKCLKSDSKYSMFKIKQRVKSLHCHGSSKPTENEIEMLEMDTTLIKQENEDNISDPVEIDASLIKQEDEDDSSVDEDDSSVDEDNSSVDEESVLDIKSEINEPELESLP